jgi:hypothetical protein
MLDGRLWKRDSHGKHKLVIPVTKRLSLIRDAHNSLGHKGLFSVWTRLLDRFWWPLLDQGVKWYIRTCHECQVRLLTKIHIPPTVPTPASLFRKVYIDTFLMPRAGGYQYVVHARCLLSSYPEWRMLRRETGSTIGAFIFQDILCRWGAVEEIQSDNGTPFVKALDYHSLHPPFLRHNSCASITAFPAQSGPILEQIIFFITTPCRRPSFHRRPRYHPDDLEIQDLSDGPSPAAHFVVRSTVDYQWNAQRRTQPPPFTAWSNPIHIVAPQIPRPVFHKVTRRHLSNLLRSSDTGRLPPPPYSIIPEVHIRQSLESDFRFHAANLPGLLPQRSLAH